MAALLALAAGSARADPVPSWLEGLWVGRGIIVPSEGLQHDDADTQQALRAGRFVAIAIQSDAFTASPMWPMDLIEGDGLNTTSGSGPLRGDDAKRLSDDANKFPPYASLGDAPTVDPERSLAFVVLSMRRCVMDVDNYFPISDHGHGTPALLSSDCDPVKLFRLSDDVIAWPALLGWIVLQRRLPAPASAAGH